jgi:hypothetical protein
MTNSVKTVEANKPKIRDQPRPEKIGSNVIGTLESIAALAVRRIGRSRTTRLSMIASKTGRPRRDELDKLRDEVLVYCLDQSLQLADATSMR